MNRAQLKQLARLVIKVVAGGPRDVTRGEELIRLFDAVIDSAALTNEIPSGQGTPFSPIAADTYGPHPQFLSQGEVNAYVLTLLTNGLYITQPPAPTGAQVDDISNIFSHNLVPGFSTASDYELSTGTSTYSVRSNAYTQAGRMFYPGLSAAYGVGEVRARVKSSGARPAGEAISNATAFTGAAPTVYTSTPQSYTVTQADIDTKCGAGTTSFQAITRTNNTATSTENQTKADEAGQAAAKAAAIAAIVCTVPASQLATPPNFQATPTSASAVSLAWTAVPNATAYVVQRATNSGFSAGLATIYTGPNTSVNNTSGLSASTTYYYRVKAQANGYTDSGFATDDAITLTVGPINRSFALILFGQSLNSKLTPTDTMPSGQGDVDFPGVAGPYARSKVAVVGTPFSMEPIQLSVNDRGYSGLAASNPASSQVGGVTPPAWELERRCTGIFNFAISYADGQPSGTFLPTAPGGANNVFNILVRAIQASRADFEAAGKAWNNTTVVGAFRQGETDGDLPSWKTDWTTIMDALIDGGYVPEGSTFAFRRVATQTRAGANLAQARANVDSLCATYTRLKLVPYDGLYYNRWDAHHDDFYSAMVEAKQLVQIWNGEPVQVAYVCPQQEATCPEGKVGPAVKRQTYSFVSMADAIALGKARAQQDVVCEFEQDFSDPDYPYLTLRKQEYRDLLNISVTNGNTLTAVGYVAPANDTENRVAKPRWGWKDDTTHDIIAYQRFKLGDVALLVGPDTDGIYANEGVNRALVGARSGQPDFNNALSEIHFGSYYKVSSSGGTVDVGANMFTPNSSGAFDPRAVVGKYLRIVYHQTKTCLYLEGPTRAQDVLLSVEKYRMETGPSIVYTPVFAWLWQGCRIEENAVAAVNLVDLTA